MSGAGEYVVLHCRVVEARDLAAADPNGYSDPYVKVKVQDHKEKSGVVAKTLSPVWNFDCSIPLSGSSSSGEVVIEVTDNDDLGGNDFLGLVKLKLSDVLQKGISGGWHSLRDKKGEKKTHGRVFVVFAADQKLSKGKSRSEHERASILFHATEQVVKEMDHHEENEAASAVAALALSPSAASTPSSLPFSSSSSPSSQGWINSPLPVQSHLSVLVGSWNVGNAVPQEDLSSWLHPGKHDVYVIGVQECSYDAPGLGQSCGDHFEHVLTRNLSSGYSLLRREELMQMRQFVYVRSELLGRIDVVTGAVEGTGLGGVVGNKGGVGVGFHIDDSSFVTVTSHLAAHQDKSSRRNEDVRDCIAAMRFNRRNVDLLHSARYIFWSGDLNYRLNFGDQGENHSPTPEQFASIVSRTGTAEGRKELFASDQLSLARKSGAVFSEQDGWSEGDVSLFAPTFKVARESGTHYKDQRSPAWCDRVLWRVGQVADSALRAQFAPKLTGIGSAPLVASSDHKPVWSSFHVPLLRLPLSTDFTRGALSIRFTRVTVRGLSTYAEKHPPHPLVKFQSHFLEFSRETKHKATIGAPAAEEKGSASPSPVSPSSASASSSAVAPVSPAHATVYEWRDAELPVLSSHINNLARLRTEPLLLKMMSYAYESSLERLIAMAEIDLSRAGHDGKPCDFDAQLTMGGLPAGRVEGTFKLEWAPQGAFTPLTREQTQAL